MGWEPTETHDLIYDDEGRHVSTVVTRESEWDDRQRDKMLGLSLYRAGLCHGCGYPKILHHPRYHFDIELERCPIKAALDRFDRIQGEADEKVREAQKNNPAAPQAKDGRQVSVRLKPPTGA